MWAIVPLMNFACVFGAGFVQVSVPKSLLNGSGTGVTVECVNGRTMIASLLVPASCLVGCKSAVS